MIIQLQSTISLKSIDSVKIRIRNISLTSNYFIRAYLHISKRCECSHDDQTKKKKTKHKKQQLVVVYIYRFIPGIALKYIKNNNKIDRLIYSGAIQ